MADVSSVVGIILGICGLVSVVVVAFSFGRSKVKDETITAQKGLIEALKEEADHHGKEIAELRARLDVLESSWASDLVENVGVAAGQAVAREVAKVVALMVRDQ